MENLNHEDFPKDLTAGDIDILSELVLENPISELWKRIACKLAPEQKVRINRRVEAKKYSKPKGSSSFNKVSMDDETWERMKLQKETEKFYGNMGQPETLQEYKNRYGVWPPEFDGSE